MFQVHPPPSPAFKKKHIKVKNTNKNEKNTNKNEKKQIKMAKKMKKVNFLGLGILSIGFI